MSTVRSQQSSCLCSCCNGFSCNPILLPAIYVPNCTLTQCLAQCQVTYSQCRINQYYDRISAECRSVSTPQYICRCQCCKIGSTSCVPSYVGSAVSFLCNIESCSIACANQYPNLCASDHLGQTQGSCVGPVTTTTTLAPWSGNTCSCACCNTGSFCSPVYVGTISDYRCTSGTCTQVCQNQYPSKCPYWSNLGQVVGTCTSSTNENIRCKCQCCGTNGCLNFELIHSQDCRMCDSMCRSRSPCTINDPITYSCIRNNAKVFLPSFIFLFSINFSIVFIIK